MDQIQNFSRACSRLEQRDKNKTKDVVKSIQLKNEVEGKRKFSIQRSENCFRGKGLQQTKALTTFSLLEKGCSICLVLPTIIHLAFLIFENRLISVFL